MPKRDTLQRVDDDRVDERVIAVIAAALDRRPVEIQPSARLHELGAESLDFLDVAFRLEKEFRIRMPRLNVLQRAEEHFGAEALVRDGLLTGFGLELLRKTMPEVDPGLIRPGLRSAELGGLLTAETFSRVVRRMLAAKREALRACPGCGGALEESSVTPEASCAACGRIQPFPAGDDVLLHDMLAVAR